MPLAPKDGLDGPRVRRGVRARERLGAETGQTKIFGRDDSLAHLVTIELRDARVVRHDLRLGTEVLQDPPFAVRPLPPVVDDVDAHVIPK